MVEGKAKVYLDSCCYNRPYDDQSEPRVFLEAQAKMLVQDIVKNGDLRLVSSTVIDFEIGRSPYKDRKLAIMDYIKRYAEDFVEVDASEEIDKMMNDIMATGVKKQDASHVACAIYGGCDYFLSTDKRLLKYQTDKIKIMNPIDFIGEMEKNK